MTRDSRSGSVPAQPFGVGLASRSSRGGPAFGAGRADQRSPHGGLARGRADQDRVLREDFLDVAVDLDPALVEYP